jgi:Tol biopolymer transport system component
MTTAGGPNLRPGWSPDGRWLAVFGDYLWLVSPTKASPERRLARDATVGVWAPDSRKIYFSGGGARRPNIYVVSAEGAGERMIADLAARPGSLGDLTTDGQNIFFTWEESLGDIWVMDVVSPKQ